MRILICNWKDRRHPAAGGAEVYTDECARRWSALGHTVTLFLAGDAVTLLKDETLDTVVGLGTGKLKDHYSFLAQNGARFFLSGMSSKARGMSDADLAGKPAEFAMPNILVRLAAEADKLFTY